MITIYFDMDGVLADFSGFLSQYGIHSASQDRRTPDEEESMWNAIQQIDSFFLKLPPLVDGIGVFNLMRVCNNCEILTAVPKPERGMPTAAADKRVWVTKYLGSTVKVHTVLRRDKIKLCNGKNTILVDDYIQNVKDWQDAGGTAILYTDARSVESQLRKVLSELNPVFNS